MLLTAHAGGLRLVATDSYRLAVRDLEGVSMLGEGQRVLVARKGLGRGAAAAPATVRSRSCCGERDVVFRTSRAEVTARLIEGDFPNYEQLIPSGYPNRLTVAREALLDALDRVQIVGQSRDNAAVRLAMSADGPRARRCRRRTSANAQESLDAKFEGTELTVAFNPLFLLDGIDAVDADEVVLETIDPLKPATLRAADSGDFLYLLMPVRTS